MKKQLVTLIFISLWSNLLAQDLPELSYREQVNNLFEQMDLKEIPSGLLLEFSSPLVDLSATSPKEMIHTVQWRSFYAGLMSAQVNENIRLLHLVSVNKKDFKS